MASSENHAAPSLPPLLRGEAATGDVLALAASRARAGTDPGLVVHDIGAERLASALVLAPEVPLEDAMASVFAVANGFADAFGALAPPEVACQFDWPAGLRVNGGLCGKLRAAASTTDPAMEPDWLVVGVELAIRAANSRDPGLTPDRTTLWDEGCAEITPRRLLESWSRHTLVWIHEWLDSGLPRLHEFWRGRAFSIGAPVQLDLAGERLAGQFVGIDEKGGMLLRTKDGVRSLPLTHMLEKV
jgi:BirA family biotin operon repressor/biotin-[acetyl-CoA-carboxylase] ligase